MNELARWDPFRSPFEDGLFGIVPSLVAPVARRASTWGPRMDVIETENAYKLAVELPGASRESIDLSVYGNTVTFSVDFGESKEDEGESWLLRERSAGKVSRSITLPEEVDDSASEAKYADGVLHVTLRKKRASQTKRLTIN